MKLFLTKLILIKVITFLFQNLSWVNEKRPLLNEAAVLLKNFQNDDPVYSVIKTFFVTNLSPSCTETIT